MIKGCVSFKSNCVILTIVRKRCHISSKKITCGIDYFLGKTKPYKNEQNNVILMGIVQ